MLAMCSVDAQRGFNCLACVFFLRLYFSVASQRLATLATFSVKVAVFFFAVALLGNRSASALDHCGTS